MPTTLPTRTSETADDFPFRTMIAIAFLGIAAGLWSGAADETRWLSAGNLPMPFRRATGLPVKRHSRRYPHIA